MQARVCLQCNKDSLITFANTDRSATRMQETPRSKDMNHFRFSWKSESNVAWRFDLFCFVALKIYSYEVICLNWPLYDFLLTSWRPWEAFSWPSPQFRPTEYEGITIELHTGNCVTSCPCTVLSFMLSPLQAEENKCVIQNRGHSVAKWLRHFATGRKVEGSRPNEVNGFFQLPSGCTRPWGLLNL
jgi:hypothetical protein